MYTLLRPEGSESKTVTTEFLNEITHPIALAWWFMDDGSRDKNHNIGNIHTNGFSEQEVRLLCQWLDIRWGIESRPCMVRHSSTGKYSYMIYITNKGFVALTELISPFVPECMAYKVRQITKECRNCGQEFTVIGQTCFCSKECKETYQEAHKQEYYLSYRQEHLDEILARGAAYREAHREEIRQKGREYRENMTEEQRAHRAAQIAAWQKANRDHINEVKRDWRRSKKGDPEYEAKLKAERAAYYQRKAADPERHAHMLELERERRKRPDVKAQELEYQRKRRALKIINDPMEAARRVAWKHCRAALLKLETEEQKREFYSQYAQEHPEFHMEAIQSDPKAWELYQQMQREKESSSSIQS